MLGLRHSPNPLERISPLSLPSLPALPRHSRGTWHTRCSGAASSAPAIAAAASCWVSKAAASALAAGPGAGEAPVLSPPSTKSYFYSWGFGINIYLSAACN